MTPEYHALAILRRIVATTHSHIDGRDLFEELHPRRRLDIKRRVDGRETWHEGDWLSGLWDAVKDARAYLYTHDHIASVGRNAERQDAEERLGPKDEHAVPPEEAGDAQTPPSESPS